MLMLVMVATAILWSHTILLQQMQSQDESAFKMEKSGLHPFKIGTLNQDARILDDVIAF